MPGAVLGLNFRGQTGALPSDVTVLEESACEQKMPMQGHASCRRGTKGKRDVGRRGRRGEGPGKATRRK